MSRWLGILLVGAGMGAVGMWAVLDAFRGPTPPHSLSSGAADGGSNGETAKEAIHALGTLEPRGGALVITSPLVGTPIQKVLVHEGQVVTAGQRLIELDPSIPEEELGIAVAQRQQAQEKQQTEIALARQRLEAANLAFEQAQAAGSVELEAQRKQVDLAATKMVQAQDDLHRLEQLQRAERPVVSAQQLEHQKTMVKLATVERDAASTALARLDQTLRFNLQKAQTEKKSAEEGLEIANRGTAVITLDRQIKLAEHKRTQVSVVAPSAGTVISVLAHSGELVSTQPLVQLGNLEQLECLAEVNVADLSRLKDRHDAYLTCRAFRGTKVKAHIERIRNVAGAATLRPVDPRKPVDRTVATVVLSVDGKEAAKLLGSELPDAASALVGLQVEVEIPL